MTTPQQTLDQALTHHRAGRRREAEVLYRQLLSEYPNHPDTLCLLGALVFDDGRAAEALVLLDRAIVINPKSADYHLNRGRVLAASGRFDEAIAAYNRAIDLRPQFPEAAFNLANALRQKGDLSAAITSYRRALELRPQFAEAALNLGITLADAGQLDAAIAAYRQAIAIRPAFLEPQSALAAALNRAGRHDEAIAVARAALAHNPDFAPAHVVLGVALQAKRQLDDAISAYRHAINLAPQSLDAYQNLSSVLCEKNLPDEALQVAQAALARHPKSPQAMLSLANAQSHKGLLDQSIANYRAALAIQPRLPEAHNGLGHTLRLARQTDQAIAACQSAIEIRPDYADAYANLSAAFWQAGRLDDALSAAEKSVALQPLSADARINLGLALEGLGRQAPAITAYQEAIAINDDPLAHFNLGVALLRQGDFAAGWPEYEWRRRAREVVPTPRQFTQPQWDGKPLAGRRILLFAEQGLGDAIHFARFVPLVAQRDGKVILQCQRPLTRLMRNLPGVDQIISDEDPLPDFDVHCSLLSLPLAMATTLESIPATIPYLTADADLIQNWRDRFANDARLKVGLVWAGSAAHGNDRNRSLPLAAFAPLANVPNLHVISLQKGPAAVQAGSAPPALTITDWTADLVDFADTAALVANLDLVITVDTAVAHLAGALAKPTWLLLPFVPDWRWLLNRADSPWHPTMRLFRQPTIGDWQTPLADLHAALCSRGAR